MHKLKRFFKVVFLGVFALILSQILLYVVAYFRPKLEIKAANSFSFYDKNNEFN